MVRCVVWPSVSVAVVMVMILSASIADAQTITGVSRSPSTTFYRGTPYTFSWTQSSGAITSVNIRLCSSVSAGACTGGATIYDSQGPFTVSGTSQSLVYTCNVAALTGTAFMEIRDAAGSGASGTSASFSVNGLNPTLASIYPGSSSVSWTRGSTVNITWTTTGVTSVNLALTHSTTSNNRWIVKNIPSSIGYYLWTVDASVPTVSFYTLRVSTNVTEAAYDSGSVAASGYVSVDYPSVSMVMIAPVTGVRAIRGSTLNITWSCSTSLVQNFNITFIRSSETKVIASNVVGTSFIWTVPADITILSSSWYVRVVAADVDPLLVGQSTSNMRADSNYIQTDYPSTSVTLTLPASSTTQAIRGTSLVISWTSTGPIYNYNITFVRSGATLVVASNVVGNSFTWTIPKSIDIQNFWYVRVTAADVSPALNGQSLSLMRDDSGYISTVRPSAPITLTSMTGSTALRYGSSVTLTWTASSSYYTNFNVSLVYASTVIQVMGAGVTSPFVFVVPSDIAYRSFYYLRVTPWMMDDALAGATNLYEDTGYISVSANGGDSSSSGGGGGGGAAAGAIIAVVCVGGFVAVVYKRHRERQAQADFAKMGISDDRQQQPVAPSKDDQYVTEGIPLCYYETAHYNPPTAQPDVLIPVVSPVGQVIGLAPQH